MSANTCKNSLGAYLQGHADGMYASGKSFADFAECQCDECKREYSEGFEDGRNLAIDRVSEDKE